jgi:predicted CxxxxCH...CXXCH cytochrome family protein
MKKTPFILAAALLAVSCSKLSPTGEKAAENPPCTTCHGTPPESGAHAFHAREYGFGCGVCHPEDPSGKFHDDGATEVNPLDPADSTPAGSWDAAGKECDNTYCHGNFEGGLSASARWTGGPAACGSCHSRPPATLAHPAHGLYDCGLCHAGYSSKSGTVQKPSHSNGIVEVNGALGSGEFHAATRTCVSVYCHGYGMIDTMGIAWNSGTVAWTDSLSCAGCHDYAGHMVTERQYLAGQYPGTSVCLGSGCHEAGFHGDSTGKATGVRCGTCHGLPPSRGAHERHALSNRYALNLDCAVCHLGYSLADSSVASTHMDGVKNVNGELAGGSFSMSDSSCANTWCHGNFPGGSHAKPGWYQAGLACGSCHGVPPSTGRHFKHVREEGIGCGSCHPGFTSATVAKAIHVNRVVNVGFSSGSYSGGNCSGISCHGTENWQGGGD